jgi:hypothetical protein
MEVLVVGMVLLGVLVIATVAATNLAALALPVWSWWSGKS